MGGERGGGNQKYNSLGVVAGGRWKEKGEGSVPWYKYSTGVSETEAKYYSCDTKSCLYTRGPILPLCLCEGVCVCVCMCVHVFQFFCCCFY